MERVPRKIKRALCYDLLTHGWPFTVLDINPNLSVNELLDIASQSAAKGSVLDATLLSRRALRISTDEEVTRRITNIMQNAFQVEGNTYAGEAQRQNARSGMEWLPGQIHAADLEVARDKAYRRTIRWKELQSAA